jgi:hypothetical protein
MSGSEGRERRQRRFLTRPIGDGDTPSFPFGSWGFSPIPLRQGFGGQGGDDGHDRSFITREFNGVALKENGTIPF